MPRHTPRPDIVLIKEAAPVAPVGTRKEDKRKAEVADRAFAAWQNGEYDEPSKARALRNACEEYMTEYYGRTIEGTYYESKLQNLRRRLRGMAPKASDVGT